LRLANLNICGQPFSARAGLIIRFPGNQIEEHFFRRSARLVKEALAAGRIDTLRFCRGLPGIRRGYWTCHLIPPLILRLVYVFVIISFIVNI
jgi:hypothetical protein